jgi:hypothetical protein
MAAANNGIAPGGFNYLYLRCGSVGKRPAGRTPSRGTFYRTVMIRSLKHIKVQAVIGQMNITNLRALTFLQKNG